MRRFIAKGQRDKGTKGEYRCVVQVILLCSFVNLSLCVVKAQSISTPQDKYSVRWTPDLPNLKDANKVAVEVSGLPVATIRHLQRLNWKQPQWQRLLSVYAEPHGSTTSQSLPPMLGRYRVESGVLLFEPQFPLDQSIAYRAIFRPDPLPGNGRSKSAPIDAIFQLPPRSATPDTVVTRIYPSADLLPENLLKFYVHFSAPMSRGNIYDYIHLLRS